jgi:hypothetical protein
LRNAPATEREFNVSRTVLALTVEFSLVLNVAVRAVLRAEFRLELVSARLPTKLLEVLRVAADRLPALRVVERATLPPELGRADERDTAGLALT